MKRANLFQKGLGMGKCLFLLLILNGLLSKVVAQGSLTPSGVPGPTMKTLSQIEPRTPISSLPYTISQPGSYYLTTNLTGVSGANGISISSGNVTLDLGGFTMQGVAGSQNGVYVTGTYTNLTVKNGIITGWGGNGLDSYYGGYPRNMLFEKLTFSANAQDGLITEAGTVVHDCLSLNNGTHGIVCYGGEISHSLARANAGNGIVAYYTTISDSVVETNGGYGFNLTQSTAMDSRTQFNYAGGNNISGARLINCQIENNGFQGVYAPAGPDEVRGCRILGNSLDGVALEGPGVVADNYLENNGNNGINLATPASGSQIINNNIYVSIKASGMFINGCSNRIDNNNVVIMGGYAGIMINGGPNTNNVVTRNSVWGGVPNYQIPAGNDAGPISTAASTTSPWANFAH